MTSNPDEAARHVSFLIKQAFIQSRTLDCTPSDFLLDLRTQLQQADLDSEQAQKVAYCEQALEILTLTKPLERGSNIGIGRQWAP